MKSYQLVLFVLFFVGLNSQAFGQRGERGGLIEVAALQLSTEAFEAAKAEPIIEAYKLSDRGVLSPNEGYQIIMNMDRGEMICLPIDAIGELEALIRVPKEAEGSIRCICEEREGCRLMTVYMEGELRTYCRGACACQIAYIDVDLKRYTRYKNIRGQWINL